MAHSTDRLCGCTFWYHFFQSLPPPSGIITILYSTHLFREKPGPTNDETIFVLLQAHSAVVFIYQVLPFTAACYYFLLLLASLVCFLLSFTALHFSHTHRQRSTATHTQTTLAYSQSSDRISFLLSHTRRNVVGKAGKGVGGGNTVFAEILHTL